MIQIKFYILLISIFYVIYPFFVLGTIFDKNGKFPFEHAVK
jgi:hypothetical protein